MKKAIIIFQFLNICNVLFQHSLNGQISPGEYTFTSKLVNRNLDILQQNRNNGAKLVIWDINNSDAQKFIVEISNESGFYYIKTKTGKCLDVNGNDKSKLHCWDCNGQDNQKWKFSSKGDGYYNIESKSGGFIDVRWAKKDNGSEVGLSAYSNHEGNAAQRWKVNGVNQIGVAIINDRLGGKFPTDLKLNEDITSKEDGITTSLSKNESTKRTRTTKSNETEESDRICWTENVNWESSQNWTFGEMDDVIYIGGIYDGNEIVKGRYKKVNVNSTEFPRVVANINSTITAISQNLSGFSNADSKSCVNKIIRNIYKENPNFKPAAQFKFELEQVVDEKDEKLMFGVNYKGFGAEIKSKFSENNRNRTNKFIGRFTQSYFTVSINDDFYSKKITTDKSTVIIDQIEFGSIGFVEFESSLSEDELNFALKAEYEGFGNRGGIEVEYYKKMLREKTKMKGFIYGGSLDRAGKLFEGNAQSILKNWQEAVKNFDINTAFVPISYKFKFLSDGAPAYLIQRTNYNRQVCQISNFLNIKLKNIFMCETGTPDIQRAHEPVAGIVYLSLWTTDKEPKNYPIEVFPEAGKNSIYFKAERHSFVAKNPSRQNLQDNNLNTIPEDVKSYKLNTKKWANQEYLVKIDFNLGIKHKDNDIAAEGGHWLKLGDAKVHEEFLIQSPGRINEKGVLTLGPYTTPTDRNHDFWLQFQVISD